MPSAIEEYAEKYGYADPANTFAAACLDQNTLEELERPGEPDETDCHNWGITAAEWRDAIRAALVEKRKIK